MSKKDENQEVATVPKPRLPWHPAIEERFGIDKAKFKALTEAIWPSAKTTNSIILALSYCQARNLDPFKRTVHIVPVWDSNQQKQIETVWPGIAELRTTATRTGEYAGIDAIELGETVKKKLGRAEVEFPRWGRKTVYRIVKGQRCAFVGPIVYWEEIYSRASHTDETPNFRWRRAPYMQFEKCVDAAALRAAFPEELGSDYAYEEMEGKILYGYEDDSDIKRDSISRRLGTKTEENEETRARVENTSEHDSASQAMSDPNESEKTPPEAVSIDSEGIGADIAEHLGEEETILVDIRKKVGALQIEFQKKQALDVFTDILAEHNYSEPAKIADIDAGNEIVDKLREALKHAG